MTAEQNKRIVRNFMELFSDAELDPAFELLADDMEWSLWGSGPAAGSYSKESMRQLLLDSWKWFDGKVSWLPTSLTAEEDRVVAEAESRALTRCGYQHANKYHLLFRLRDGKIVQLKEMFQEGPVQRLFNQLQSEAASLPARSDGPGGA